MLHLISQLVGQNTLPFPRLPLHWKLWPAVVNYVDSAIRQQLPLALATLGSDPALAVSPATATTPSASSSSRRSASAEVVEFPWV